MKSFSKLLGLLGLTFLLVLLSLFVWVPKFVLLDARASKEGLFLLPAEVKEQFTGFTARKGRLFFKGRELLRFDELRLKLLPLQRLELVCGEGRLSLVFFLKRFRALEAEGYRCLSFAEEVSGRVRAVGDGFEGRLVVKGLVTDGTKAERLELVFEGKRFRGKVVLAPGLTLTGGGSLKPGGELLDTRVEGSFRGSAGGFRLSGTLGRLRVEPL
ncbi:MAG: hypothetical protein GXO03_02670 [Aquificae bacterium]|nr:hypothetical protein [Aquificota bacterium]